MGHHHHHECECVPCVEPGAVKAAHCEVKAAEKAACEAVLGLKAAKKHECELVKAAKKAKKAECEAVKAAKKAECEALKAAKKMECECVKAAKHECCCACEPVCPPVMPVHHPGVGFWVFLLILAILAIAWYQGPTVNPLV